MLYGSSPLVGSVTEKVTTGVLPWLVPVTSRMLYENASPDGFGYYIRTRLLPYSGMIDWWADTKTLFSPIVQSWVAIQISKTDMESDFLGIK